MRYVEKNIVDAPELIIIHGCNMRGVMGSGVAKALRDKYPQIYDAYKVCLKDKKLGDHITAICGSPPKLIGNLLTQNEYGYDRYRYAELDAIRDALISFVEDYLYRSPITPSHYEYLTENNLKVSIASPKIGCGRGGLSWSEVSKIYEMVENNYPVEFVIYDIPDQYSK